MSTASPPTGQTGLPEATETSLGPTGVSLPPLIPAGGALPPSLEGLQHSRAAKAPTPPAEVKVLAEYEADLRPAGQVNKTKAPASLLTKSGRWGTDPFRHLTTLAALTILLVLAAVATFLVIQALPAITTPNLQLRMIGRPEGVGLLGFTGPQLFGTLLAAILAMVLAVPVALAVALFITQIAPPKFAAALGHVVDLLAAIPSVVYGLWGGLVLLPLLQPVMKGASQVLGFLPPFAGPVSPVGRVLFAAAVILAVMILPVITALSREVFARTPQLQMEAALALGATRWEAIRLVVLPFGRSGVISAAMLGLGRALGETMAVAMVLSPGASYAWSIFQAGKHSTIAANIALQYPEADQITASALVATGLVLFLITLAVNTAARLLIARTTSSRSSRKARS